MATPDLPPWAVTTQIIRITSSASRASAAVRHFHRSPVRRSNLEARDRRSGGRLARMAATSWRPKKKERCTMSSSGMMLPLVSGTSSYSRCAKAGRGGSRASSSSLPHTGRTVGPAAPRASSATAPRNCTSPCASAIVWCSRTPRMKPPHARRVTCTPHTDKDAVTCLEEEERRAQDLGRAGDVKDELLEAWERRLQLVPEVIEPDVSLSLDEQHTLAGTIHGELATF
uniref:Uncharacterized protein n=1 Tax=Zea mays TaxID=4577 RepID=A0A804NPP0_MAIZE